MRVAVDELRTVAARASGGASRGGACAWLEACGYRGMALLLEALAETPVERRGAPAFTLTLGGVDGGGISAVFLGEALVALARQHGRITYRNARHGLYVLPFAVNANIGIGCPVDPAFHIGGERTSNPYAEKLAAAEREGLALDPALWRQLQAQAA